MSVTVNSDDSRAGEVAFDSDVLGRSQEQLAAEHRGAGKKRNLSRIHRMLSFRNISAIYILVAELIIFPIWLPHLFFRPETFANVLGEQALTGIASLGLLVCLSTGVFDLAVGTEVGAAAILVAWLLSAKQIGIGLAIVITLVVGAIIGLVNGFLVVKLRIESLIATLGVSSVLTGLISWLSGGAQIIGLSDHFQRLGNGKFLGLIYPFWILLVLAVVVGYFMELTPMGRRFYATGGNLQAARLAGVRTAAAIVSSFIVCGVMAAVTGTLISAQFAAGDPTVGPGYLLPTFTAVFLGSTQFRDGRFNVLGTLVAVFVLALGVKGLQLAGAPIWIPDIFDGVALLGAVALAKVQKPNGQPSDLWKLIRRFQIRRGRALDPAEVTDGGTA